MSEPWKPIAEAPPYDYKNGDEQRFIVWNGKDDPGEATRREDYGEWDGESEIVPVVWSWSHRSTCGCCGSSMDPQPIMFRLMVDPPTGVS